MKSVENENMDNLIIITCVSKCTNYKSNIYCTISALLKTLKFHLNLKTTTLIRLTF